MAKSDEWHDDLAGRVTVVETLIDDIPNRTRSIEVKLAVLQIKMAGVVFFVALVASVLGTVIGRQFG